MKTYKYVFKVFDDKTGIELCQIVILNSCRVECFADITAFEKAKQQVIEQLAKPRFCERYGISAGVFQAMVKYEGLNPLYAYNIKLAQRKIIND